MSEMQRMLIKIVVSVGIVIVAIVGFNAGKKAGERECMAKCQCVEQTDGVRK